MRGRVTQLTSALTPLQFLIARRWRPKWVCRRCRRPQLQLRSLTTATSRTSTSNGGKPYYITTPIFYVNAAPHVGHMYCMILTDVVKRWQELKGRRSILCTGTDEHGMKIQQAAAKAGVQPEDFCDDGAEVFKNLAGRIDVSNDIFIRTTDKKHKEAVEYAWQMLQDRGYIYESKHEGWYSVSDETFYPQGQVQLIVDPPTGRKTMVSVETGKEVEWTSERNYHFRLSALRDQLLDFYEQHPGFIVPRSRMDEIVQQVSAGLEDLSISRPVDRLSWGIRVPTDQSQTIYVWLDALLSYATAAGFPFTPGSEIAGSWPADVHVVGKDIIRFHCIYWPAFLMALDLPLPKQVLTTAHWTLGRQKMAKSTGNVVNPFFALERFGTDIMRWYLVHDGGITDDADYDNRFIIEKYKKGLQGGLGNLTSRIMRGKGWDVQRAVKRFALSEELTKLRLSKFGEGSEDTAQSADQTMFHRLRVLPSDVDKHMRDLFPNRAVQRIMKAVYDANGYLQQASPWNLATKLKSANGERYGWTDQEREKLEEEIDRIVYLNAETLRLVGIMLQPVIPTSAKRLLDMIGVAEEKRSWDWCWIGRDDSYGVPMVELGRGEEGVLFPGLRSDF